MCTAHARRELIYVIDTAAPAVADLAAQGAEAIVAVQDLVDDARAGHRQPDPDPMAAQRPLRRSAFVLGNSATTGRATTLEGKDTSLVTRLIDRWADYPRDTTDPAVSFDHNP
ncbi:MAG: transposase, partial [Actinobacteria bacterium]|nr:transposase [Actinomycetota bacterium]